MKKIQGLFKDLHRNIRTFQGNVKGLFKDFPFKFKDFSRLCEPWNVTDSTYHKRASSKCDWAKNVTRSTKVVLRDFLFFINLTISYLHMNNRNIIIPKDFIHATKQIAHFFLILMRCDDQCHRRNLNYIACKH